MILPKVEFTISELETIQLALQQLKSAYEGKPLEPMMFYTMSPSSVPPTWAVITQLLELEDREAHGEALMNAQLNIMTILIDRVS